MAAEAVARRLAPINTAMATAGEPAPRLGFVGIGTINVAVLKGLIKADPGPRSQKMCLGPRNAAKAAALLSEFPDAVVVAGSNQEVLDASDWILVGTPPGPENTQAALQGLKWDSRHTIISMISGVSAEFLSGICEAAGTIVQVIPLPPAEIHASTTLVCPPHPAVEAMFGKLGKVVSTTDRVEMVKLMAISCAMGTFYCHLRALQEWLVANGIEPSVAGDTVAAYTSTFHAASAAGGEHTFNELVKEQTPGGMNEQVLTELTDKGNFENIKAALDKLLPRLLG